MTAQNITLRSVCRALRDDENSESGWVREAFTGKISIPRSIWLADAKLWIARDGGHVTGYPEDHSYQYRDFGLIGRLLVRRAIRRWIWQRGLRL